MTSKTYWSTEEVENYLKSLKAGSKLQLPNDAFCTENFTWNEVLQTNMRNIDMPSRQILENLKSSADVLQNYRNKIGYPITITSGWRTPSEQQDLINKGRKPSSTSLHLEGLAFDFLVKNRPLSEIHKYLDSVHMGEVEFGNDYTHISLPTFSKLYLQRHGIYSDKIYRKLDIDNIELSPVEKNKIIKRFTEKNPSALIPDHFNPQKNSNTFKDVKINLINYKNDELPPSSLTGKIFTREDIAKMTSGEFTKYEKSIDKQLSSIGIPTEYEAQEAVRAGRIIWVAPYTRLDGTKVNGYYRTT